MSLDGQKAKSDRFLEASDIASAPSGARESGNLPLQFNTKEFVVYPAHGAGQILSIEQQTVAGASLEFFVIYFTKSKLTVRVPIRKAANVGMRKLSDLSLVKEAKRVLSGTPRKGRGNWSRLAQEYEGKINSEISSRSPRLLAICSERAKPNRVSANDSSTCRRSTASAEKSHWWTEFSEEQTIKELEGLLKGGTLKRSA